MRLLDDALEHLIPGSRIWERKRYPPAPRVHGETTYCIQLPSPVRRNGQSLVIQLRHDGDVQVEYHIDENRRNSFETFFILPMGEEEQVIRTIAQFVADILTERIVLLRFKSSFGKTRFVERSSVTESDLQGVRWITSWLGTFDRSTPG